MEGEIQPTLSPRLGAGRAFGMLALVFVAQTFFGIVVVIVGMFIAVARDVNFEDKRQMTQAMESMNAPLLLIPILGSAAALYFLALAWVPSWLHDRSSTGFGSVRLSLKQIVVAAGCGVAIGVVYCVLVSYMPPSPDQLGPLAKIAARPGLGRAALAVVAVLLAPPFEEVFFRGVLFKGFAESWGFVPAGILVTVLFVGSHVFEIFLYWPAALAILTLALATLAVRLKTSSVGSAILLHASYNLVVMVAFYLGKHG